MYIGNYLRDTMKGKRLALFNNLFIERKKKNVEVSFKQDNVVWCLNSID